MSEPIRFAYFGGEPLGVPVLSVLYEAGLVPSLVVASPDRPAGRGLSLTPPPVKAWAMAHDIPVFQPTSLRDQADCPPLTNEPFDVFVVVAYNKILPAWVLQLPRHGCLNVHPSLLPRFRGASPIRSAILEDARDAIGVSVMLLDEAMDHGPLLAQTPYPIADADWPIDGQVLDAALAEVGGQLLARTLPRWVAGDAVATTQDHDQATYCGKISRSDGELIIDPHHLPTGAAAYQSLLKIRAYSGWPGTYFLHEDRRVKINTASLDTSGTLQIDTVTPAGKKPQPFVQYLKGLS